MGLAVFWGALVIIMVAYMSLWYELAVYVKRYDVVDSAWGLGFVLVAWTCLAIRQNFGSLQIVSALLATVWGIRLFAHLANRNWRRPSDDPRYVALQNKWGTDAPRKFYINVFLLQGLLILLISTPLAGIAFNELRANALTWLGWVVWLGGIVFEAVADYQLATFVRQRPKNSHALMTTGLWRYSRHPNYFGEIVVWWGAALVALSCHVWWGLIGALTITFLITKVSGIPPIEKRYEVNKQYKIYRQQTATLVPRPPKIPSA